MSNELTELQHDLIIGSLLGDGSLHMSGNSKNPFFRIMHGIEQESYCQDKFDIIKELCNIDNLKHYNNCPTLYTKRLSLLHNYKNMSIMNKLDQLNENSMTIWYLDDGYYSYKLENGYDCSISTARFTVDELKYCMEILINKFGIETVVNKNKNKKYGHQGIRIQNLKNRTKLFEVVLNSGFGYIARNSMFYKISKGDTI